MSDKETAPRVSRQANTRRALTTEEAVIHEESSAPYAHSSTEGQDRPCACLEGWVFIGYEDEYGEEREASYPCRRCSETS
jgi:hypothetical protein